MLCNYLGNIFTCLIIDYQVTNLLNNDTTEELCRQEVLNDCLCEAAVFNDSTCFKKRMPIQNARSINPATNNMVALQLFNNSKQKALCFKGCSGSSGILKLEDEEVEVVVQELGNGIEQGDDKVFLAEVRVIGLTYHKNLVPLLGFCKEKTNRLLVYELMKNGAVSNLIFRHGQRPRWKLRSDIVLDIARFLLYLHEECENQIIHCDIKPLNILLDKNNTAKIADFGLAKLRIKDQMRTKTIFRGTRGYMAPEWLKNVPETTKVDPSSKATPLPIS
ncbi:G-type lectin S-receptor-like serine/threonine-protein kinase LECRK1 [Solanum verrucosum]|nr:G-type lectin S-receptor-like serine/threonine-protein kinase LECRK1 [Solanum verrucosum]